MKTLTAFGIGLLLVLMRYGPLTAGNCNPDSLENVTLTGIVQIDATGAHDLYFLSVDDLLYRLNFGPWWYEPVDGDAVRPEDGDTVEISGGLNNTNPGTLPVIIVYEIDGQFWRNPYEPHWNQFNNDYSADPESYFLSGVACGWPDSTFVLETFTGVVMIDTTLIYLHYFLDVDYDGLPDYKLNFGPPWYEPVDSIILPVPGDTITIDGAIVHVAVYPVVIVFNIDGLVWRDFEGYGDGKFGKWMHGSQNTDALIFSPFDTSTRLQFRNGWFKGGLPGNMYCQVLEIFPQNTGQELQNGVFAGFEIGFLDHNRNNYMKNGQHGSGMHFSNQFTLQLHYFNSQLEQRRIMSNNQIRLYYWDEDASAWFEALGFVVDTSEKLITYSAETLHAYYILVGEEITTAQSYTNSFTKLISVFPNPVNDELAVQFELTSITDVTIDFVTITGQIVKSSRYHDLQPGFRTLQFGVNDIPAGMYVMSLRTQGHVINQPVFVVD